MRKILTITLASVVLWTACTSNQVITSITVAVDAAEVALPIVAGATGVDPALIMQLENYLGATSQALAAATDILAKGEPPAQEAADITAAFAGIALPNLPPGLPSAVTQAVQKVAMLVAQFLANLPAATASAARARAVGVQPAPVFNKKDLAKLGALHERAVSLAAQARKGR